MVDIRKLHFQDLAWRSRCSVLASRSYQYVADVVVAAEVGLCMG